MARLMLSDELWSKLRTIMRQQGIYDKPDLRLMIEAMLYRMRIGCPWRDLPREARFKNWCRKWKLNLIEEFNPTWRDLYEELCS